jgi:hypothetical protein
VFFVFCFLTEARSSLLSNWYLENKGKGKETTLIHHVGCGAEATDCMSMLRRVFFAFPYFLFLVSILFFSLVTKIIYVDNDIYQNSIWLGGGNFRRPQAHTTRFLQVYSEEKVHRVDIYSFVRWIQTATQGKRFVLVIDGLDQIDNVDGAHNLGNVK